MYMYIYMCHSMNLLLLLDDLIISLTYIYRKQKTSHLHETKESA